MGASEPEHSEDGRRGTEDRCGGGGHAGHERDERLGALLECLSGLGAPGRRAREFLESAGWLLRVDSPGFARRGEAVAYCVREASASILKSAGDEAGDSGWGDLSRGVVDAKSRFVRAGRFGEAGDLEEALGDLLAEIDRLDEFHEGEPKRSERQAAEVVARLTGTHALRGGLAPLRDFLGVHSDASRLLHSSCSVERAGRLLADCADAMLAVLRSPDEKRQELAEVAGRACPGRADLEEALRRVASVGDLEVFLDSAADPGWLVLLDGEGLLDPVDRSAGWRAARRAATRLAGSHRRQVVDWLAAVAEKHRGDHDGCAAVVGALLDLGEPEYEAALRIAAAHPRSEAMPRHFRSALVGGGDFSGPVVEKCADIFLNSLAPDGDPDQQPHRSAVEGLAPDIAFLLGMVCEGADEHNAEARIAILVRKVAAARFRYGQFEVLPLGSDWRLPVSILGDWEPLRSNRGAQHDLAGALVRIVGKAMGWLSAGELLELVEDAPGELAGRLRTWILAGAVGADPEAMAAEIEQAIATRFPTCDDIALIDRAAGALGPDRWRYPYFWSPLLPEPAAEAWAGAPGLHILSARIGPPEDRDFYLALTDSPENGVWEGPAPSPLSAESLRALGPARAAEEIAAWRPQPSDWAHSSRLVADTLEQLVRDDPDGWLSDPLAIAVRLRQPTYIARYLRAAAAGVAADNPDAGPVLPIGGLVDVMTMAQAEPWPAEQLAPADGLGDHYDPDWAQARRAGTDLAKALIDSGVGMGGRDDEVWDYLETEARTNPDTFDVAEPGQDGDADPVERMLEAAVESNTDNDPLFLGINQANSRAVDAALSLMAQEHKTTQTVRPQAVGLIEWCLHQPGLQGARFRGIIAPAARLLHHILPDWFDRNKDLLFGDGAPGRLGQLTVDVAVNWSQPWDWLLDNCADSIYDSAGRGVEQSYRWLVAAMLHQVGGYEPNRIAQRLDGRVEQACGVLAGMIGQLDDTTPDQMEAITSFCDAVIGHRQGRHAAVLGRLAYADSLDHDTWAAITLKTLDATGGRIGQSHQIAERILETTPIPDSAAILAHLVEVQTNQALTATGSGAEGQQPDHYDGAWARRLIADQAADWLHTAEDRQPGDEYHQLEKKLKDHGLWNPTSPPPEQQGG